MRNGLRPGSCLLAWLLLASLGLPQGATGQEVLQPTRPYSMATGLHFDSLDGNDPVPATELSGIACGPPSPDGERLCLLVDNEAKWVQPARIRDGIIMPLPRIPIAESGIPAGTGGQPPSHDTVCAAGNLQNGRSMDGEGVAFDGDRFYVTASHGCSSRNGHLRPAMFLLARLRLDDAGKPVGPIETTFRLANVLSRTQPVSEHFGKPIGDAAPGGLNIEGIAAAGGRLFLGLRAPSLGENAHIVSVPADALFDDAAPLPAATVLAVKLGRNTGIRDLAMLPDGQLLILSGPSQDQLDIGTRIWRLRLPSQGETAAPPQLLACIPTIVDAGAEGLVVMSGGEGPTRVLVLYDGLPDGGGQEFTLPATSQPC